MSIHRQRGFDRRKVLDRFFGAFCALAIGFAALLLIALLWNVWQQGAPRLGLKEPLAGQLTGRLAFSGPEQFSPLLTNLVDAYKAEQPKVQVRQGVATEQGAIRNLIYGTVDVLLAPPLTPVQRAEVEKNRFEVLEIPYAMRDGQPINLYASAKNANKRELEYALKMAAQKGGSLASVDGFSAVDASMRAEGEARLDAKLESGLDKLVRFLTSFPSTFPDQAGIKAALWGSLWVIGLTALISIPLGIAAAIYLEEFTLRKNRLTEFIQLNIANLAGVPSIVYGLLGLAMFVRWFSLDRSVIAGALTMSLLILPMIIIVSQEALRAVPRSYRDGSFAMGASHWQTIRRQVLPAALPGILTGVILSVSRAMGETAPIITIGAVTFLLSVPSGVGDTFTALPIQIYNWSDRPEPAYREAAAAAILVLLAVLILLNSIAITLRYRYRSKA